MPEADVGRHEAHLAWKNAAAALALVLCGELVFAGLDYRLFGWGPELYARVAHLALTASLLVALLVRRRRPSERFAVGATTVVLVTLVPLFWLDEVAMATAGQPWTPFIGHRLVMLGVAALMPGPTALVVAVVLLFASAAFLQFFAFGIVEHNEVVNYGEPWVTGVYTLVALSVVVLRDQNRRLGREFERSAAEAEALRALARFLLALRDLSNTPIQTLEIDTAILERRHPEDKAAIRRMRTAVGQLREISRILAQSDHLAHWDRQRESFDPNEALQWLGRADERPGDAEEATVRT